MIEIEDDSIDIYVVGPGFGECVVIVIGKRFVIGIDSCYQVLQPYGESSSLLDHILGQSSDETIFYWMLTHFHSDHFQSLTKVLQRLGERVSELIVPPCFTAADVHYNLENISKYQNKTVEATSCSQYAELRRLLESDFFRPRVSSSSGKRLLVKESLRFKRKEIPLVATVFGPPDSKLNTLSAAAIKRLMLPKGNQKPTRANANEGSYILQIEYGGIEMLHLGDAPLSQTLSFFSQGVSAKDKLFILKVAHHGSPTGTDESLLSILGPESPNKHALITPFDVNGLPDLGVMHLLDQHGFHTRVSGGRRIVDQTGEVPSKLNFVTHGTVDSFKPLAPNIIRKTFRSALTSYRKRRESD